MIPLSFLSKRLVLPTSACQVDAPAPDLLLTSSLLSAALHFAYLTYLVSQYSWGSFAPESHLYLLTPPTLSNLSRLALSLLDRCLKVASSGRPHGVHLPASQFLILVTTF